MSDCFPTSVTIYSVPSAEVATRVHDELLDGFTDWTSDGRATGLQLGFEYHDGEYGGAYDLAMTLGELGCAFEIHQGANYEYNGWLMLHVPGVGSFESDCGQDGTVHVAERELDKVVDAWRKGECDDIDLAIDTLTGRRIRNAITELAKSLIEATLPS